MFTALGVLFLVHAVVCTRESGKGFRSLPAISNSLVNLGKMDINIHFNSKPDSQSSSLRPEQTYMQSASPFFIPRSDPMLSTIEIEPCPCSSFKDFRNPFVANNPPEIVNKILKSNDLFSYNQEPVFSSTCCESHERAHEETLVIDITPKSQIDTMGSIPKMLNAILPKLQLQGASNSNSNMKPKAIEIFFFPKNKDGFLDLTKLTGPKGRKIKKSDIKIVGNRSVLNGKREHNGLKSRPSPSLQNQDMHETRHITEEKQEITTNKQEKPEVIGDGELNNEFKRLKYRPSYYQLPNKVITEEEKQKEINENKEENKETNKQEQKPERKQDPQDHEVTKDEAAKTDLPVPFNANPYDSVKQ